MSVEGLTTVMRGFTTTAISDTIPLEGLTLSIADVVGPDSLPVRLFLVRCDQWPKWHYIAKSVEEARALVHGISLGQRGEP